MATFPPKACPSQPTADFHWLSQQAPLQLFNRELIRTASHSADYALLKGLLRSSWWLILGLFLHFTHLLTSMLPPVVAVTLVVQSQAGCWLSFSAICTNAPSRFLPPDSFPIRPLSHDSMNTFLVCSEEHPGAHYVIICLSCFASPLNPCS